MKKIIRVFSLNGFILIGITVRPASGKEKTHSLFLRAKKRDFPIKAENKFGTIKLISDDLSTQRDSIDYLDLDLLNAALDLDLLNAAIDYLNYLKLKQVVAALSDAFVLDYCRLVEDLMEEKISSARPESGQHNLNFSYSNSKLREFLKDFFVEWFKLLAYVVVTTAVVISSPFLLAGLAYAIRKQDVFGIPSYIKVPCETSISQKSQTGDIAKKFFSQAQAKVWDESAEFEFAAATNSHPGWKREGGVTLLPKQVGMNSLATCDANGVSSYRSNNNIPLPVQNHHAPITQTFAPPGRVIRFLAKPVISPRVYTPTFSPHKNLAAMVIPRTSVETETRSSERNSLLTKVENDVSPRGLEKLKKQVKTVNENEQIEAYIYENTDEKILNRVKRSPEMLKNYRTHLYQTAVADLSLGNSKESFYTSSEYLVSPEGKTYSSVILVKKTSAVSVYKDSESGNFTVSAATVCRTRAISPTSRFVGPIPMREYRPSNPLSEEVQSWSSNCSYNESVDPNTGFFETENVISFTITGKPKADPSHQTKTTSFTEEGTDSSSIERNSGRQANLGAQNSALYENTNTQTQPNNRVPSFTRFTVKRKPKAPLIHLFPPDVNGEPKFDVSNVEHVRRVFSGQSAAFQHIFPPGVSTNPSVLQGLSQIVTAHRAFQTSFYSVQETVSNTTTEQPAAFEHGFGLLPGAYTIPLVPQSLNRIVTSDRAINSFELIEETVSNEIVRIIENALLHYCNDEVNQQYIRENADLLVTLQTRPGRASVLQRRHSSQGEGQGEGLLVLPPNSGLYDFTEEATGSSSIERNSGREAILGAENSALYENTNTQTQPNNRAPFHIFPVRNRDSNFSASHTECVGQVLLEHSPRLEGILPQSAFTTPFVLQCLSQIVTADRAFQTSFDFVQENVSNTNTNTDIENALLHYFEDEVNQEYIRENADLLLTLETDSTPVSCRTSVLQRPPFSQGEGQGEGLLVFCPVETTFVSNNIFSSGQSLDVSLPRLVSLPRQRFLIQESLPDSGSDLRISTPNVGPTLRYHPGAGAVPIHALGTPGGAASSETQSQSQVARGEGLGREVGQAESSRGVGAQLQEQGGFLDLGAINLPDSTGETERAEQDIASESEQSFWLRVVSVDGELDQVLTFSVLKGWYEGQEKIAAPEASNVSSSISNQLGRLFQQALQRLVTIKTSNNPLSPEQETVIQNIKPKLENLRDLQKQIQEQGLRDGTWDEKVLDRVFKSIDNLCRVIQAVPLRTLIAIDLLFALPGASGAPSSLISYEGTPCGVLTASRMVSYMRTLHVNKRVLQTRPEIASQSHNYRSRVHASTGTSIPTLVDTSSSWLRLTGGSSSRRTSTTVNVLKNGDPTINGKIKKCRYENFNSGFKLETNNSAPFHVDVQDRYDRSLHGGLTNVEYLHAAQVLGQNDNSLNSFPAQVWQIQESLDKSKKRFGK